MPAGRPTLYREEYCERVIALGAEGKSPAQIAGMLGVDKATLIEWGKVHAEFSTALTRAKTLEQLWWENAGQSGLLAERFQQQVWAKSMQARFRDDYTERKELGGIGGGPLQVSVMRLTDDDPGASD